MAEFRFFTPENTGYFVPDEILEGDYRKMEGKPDPDAAYAAQIVANQMEEPNQDAVEAVHLELSRLRRTFDDIQSQGEAVSLEAYWYARDLYGSRIQALLRGEELPKW